MTADLTSFMSHWELVGVIQTLADVTNIVCSLSHFVFNSVYVYIYLYIYIYLFQIYLYITLLILSINLKSYVCIQKKNIFFLCLCKSKIKTNHMVTIYDFIYSQFGVL